MVYATFLLIVIGFFFNSISRKYSLHELYYKRQFSKHAVEIGEEFEIAVTIENCKILPIAYLQIIETLPKTFCYKFPGNILYDLRNITHKSTMFMLPKQKIKRKFKVSIDSRGKHTISYVNLIAGDFFGISTVRKKLESTQEIVVYPKAINLDMELTPYGSFYGDISVQRWIINDPVLNIGIREYTGSDPQKSIHWPSSLKSGTLMVKKYDFTTDNRVMIILNIECGKPSWSNINKDKIEKCISITRTVMEQLEELGTQYGFSSSVKTNEFYEGKDYVPYGCGTYHFYGILELLGRINYYMDAAFEDVLTNFMKNEGGYTTVVMITPSVLDDYIDSINNLSNNVNKTVLIAMGDSNMANLNENIITYLGK